MRLEKCEKCQDKLYRIIPQEIGKPRLLLPNTKPKHHLPLQEQLQNIAHMHLSHPLRCSSKNAVAFLKGDEARNMGNDAVEGENHVAAVTLLRPFAIEFHAEGDVGGILQFADSLELADGCGIVEGFGDFPRVAFGFAAALQVAGGEVDAHSDSVIILSGVDFKDIFP